MKFHNIHEINHHLITIRLYAEGVNLLPLFWRGFFVFFDFNYHLITIRLYAEGVNLLPLFWRGFFVFFDFNYSYLGTPFGELGHEVGRW